MQRKLEFGGQRFAYAQFLKNQELEAAYCTERGALFSGDCLQILPSVEDACVDMVFADPPFNIGKEYGGGVNDNRREHEYLNWCHAWIQECSRTLKEGGAFFLYNIPRWNLILARYLEQEGLHFRDWIVVDIKFGLPIPGRLYPSHYSLLYYTKGRHKIFRNIRIPIATCRHCGGEIKDYGGHRGAMNPKGVNLTDVWIDIPPVRHWKFKNRKRKANALSTKLVDRVVEMTTTEGGVVLDPFGGSGTTYAVCERRNRFWIGMDIESTDVIIERLESDDLAYHKNDDFVDA